jgi:hypothetical protein
MLSARGRGKDSFMASVPIVHRRQGGVLLAGFGLILIVTWMLVTAWSCACAIDDPPAMAPAAAAPGLIARPTAPGDDRLPEEPVTNLRAARREPLLVDRSRDRRADLMDMAISLRWHRGAPSGLPPGSE